LATLLQGKLDNKVKSMKVRKLGNLKVTGYWAKIASNNGDISVAVKVGFSKGTDKSTEYAFGVAIGGGIGFPPAAIGAAAAASIKRTVSESMSLSEETTVTVACKSINFGE